MSADLRRSVNDSITANLMLAFFSIIKLLISSIVLMVFPHTCAEPLDIWLILIIIHDLFYAGSQLVLVYQIIHTNYAEEEEIVQDEYGQIRQLSAFSLTDRAQRKNRLISALSEGCRV